jgi:hypothetical protein
LNEACQTKSVARILFTALSALLSPGARCVWLKFLREKVLVAYLEIFFKFAKVLG